MAEQPVNPTPLSRATMPPPGFSWVDQPHLAGMAHPGGADDLTWLRRHGIDVLISLTEDPLPRHWVNDAGLMVVNVPVPDMEPPTDRQLDYLLETIRKANASGMGVAVHCGAGMGRTGTVLAAYFVARGLPPREAVEKVRDLRPGSVETIEQERAVERFATRSNSRKPTT
jgi:atypical dual specificity phosphatase